MNKPVVLTDYVDFTYYKMPVADRRKLDVGDIFLNQVKCNNCGWIIRSKNRHHMAQCKCGKSFVDGGSWYQRTGGDITSLVLLYRYRSRDG